jgi:anti-sigma regulatory factor (Ser/Thr protein kinase)/biotin operon repressor
MTERERILALARRLGRITSGAVADKLGISRQAAHRKLQQLADTGDLVLRGAGRGAAWELAATAPRTFRYENVALAEDRVYAQLQAEVPRIASLDGPARSVVAYAVTEIVNNAIEHSAARSIRVTVEPTPGGLTIEIADDGVGAFARLREGLGLASDLEAVQELSKGKVTTDAARHTGEGIFFTSKVADRFELEANGLRWLVDNERDDVALAPAPVRPGTRVRLTISTPVHRTLDDVFAAWTTGDAFDRTRTVVKLFAVGVEFVSRSEARRLLHGLERFREVVLDFGGVEAVGQGFVDEVFRVWATQHPEVRLVPQRANATVSFMLERAGIARDAPERSTKGRPRTPSRPRR